MTPYRPPAHTPTKHRVIHLWSETWGKTTALSLTNQEIKRQEVSFEFSAEKCKILETNLMINAGNLRAMARRVRSDRGHLNASTELSRFSSSARTHQ